jgi:glycine C-acetyltransferase
MADLEAQLKQARADGVRDILITSDGVFSMDGFIAPLDRITALAKQYGAMVHIDECHATGFIGATGRGSAEARGVLDAIDIFTGTLGKALGGALGGFTTGKREVIELLRQRSRPTCSPTRCRRTWSPPASACSTCWPRPATCARSWREHRYFRERMTAPASTSSPASIRSCR